MATKHSQANRFSSCSIDCAGILKLRNSDIELRKGETDIGRKNTRVRVVFRVHIPQSNGKVLSLQAASIPVECCECLHHEPSHRASAEVLLRLLLLLIRPFYSRVVVFLAPTAQRSAQELPQVDKSSLSSCLVSGGEEMVISGSNFFPESKVIFLEKGPGELVPLVQQLLHL